MRRVLVDQGSAVEIMYPDLYNGLNLKPEDLTAYDSPLVSFEGKTVTPRGQIRLPIQTGSNVVEVDFIVVWWMLIHLIRLSWPSLGFML